MTKYYQGGPQSAGKPSKVEWTRILLSASGLFHPNLAIPSFLPSASKDAKENKLIWLEIKQLKQSLRSAAGRAVRQPPSPSPGARVKGEGRGSSLFLFLSSHDRQPVAYPLPLYCSLSLKPARSPIGGHFDTHRRKKGSKG
jgi:hypothetical protein